MLPWNYGFHWDTGHLIFLGVFYAVVLIVLATVTFAWLRARKQATTAAAEAIRWRTDFQDLPARARRCRHDLTGEVEERICANSFACGHCEEHPKLLGGPERVLQPGIAEVSGLDVPLDRYYHRGHTWVQQEEDGTLTVGLDEFAAHLLENPDHVELPRAGTPLQVNGTAWRVQSGGAMLRVLAPVEGDVIASGSGEAGWYLRVKPRKPKPDLRHLLRGMEAAAWMRKEIEHMQLALPAPELGATVADGGAFLGRPDTLPQADWDALRAEMLLQI